jgi:AcrR family transcriptional regulator
LFLSHYNVKVFHIESCRVKDKVKALYIDGAFRHNGAMRQSTKRDAEGKRIKKRTYHHGALRAAMIEAALKLIAKHGPRGFSLSEAARLAGVSVGAPYRHFADKEALFSEIAAQGFVELSERIEAVAKTSPDDPRKRLVAIGMAYVRFAVERPSHFEVMFDSAIHRRKDSPVDVPADRAYQILAETVHEAAAKKDVRSEETLTAATWALMHGHAMFAMDNSFTNMEFKTPVDTLVHDSFELLMETHALRSH